MIRKGQEEIAGFVLIVVIISIVILIFLGLFIMHSKNQPPQESEDVYQFLESAMSVTTGCAIGYEPAYDSLSQLIIDCEGGKICTSGGKACVILNSTLNNLLNASWQAGTNRVVKGYNFTSVLENNETSKMIISVFEGSCNSTIRGAEYLSPEFSGTISDTLRVCY